MRSKVTKLYDYTQSEVPNQLRLWRVTDSALEEHLTTLGRSHALERDVDEVRTGDSVVCRGESAVGRWNKPVLLFYPGSGLCEKVIEDALVGMKTGESKAVAASEGEVTLTVSRIVRREAHPVNDELVRLEAVEGVETLDAYCRWYRETTEQADRRRNLGYLAHHLLDAIVENSEYEIDEAEETAWAEAHVEEMRRADESNGIDPTVPEEGTDFLTEEQVKEKYIKQLRPFFRTQVACAAAAVALSGQDEEVLFQEELAFMAEKYYHTTVEALLEQIKGSEDAMRGQAFQNRAMTLLRTYSEKLLED